MQHWYVYHSTKIMEHGYASLRESAVYSKVAQHKLCLRDVIWVIEGPGHFTLVDCFRYDDTDYGPFPAPFHDFKIKAKSDKSLLARHRRLTLEQSWFDDLHSRYITKQRFFSRIDPMHIRGLISESGVAL